MRRLITAILTLALPVLAAGSSALADQYVGTGGAEVDSNGAVTVSAGTTAIKSGGGGGQTSGEGQQGAAPADPEAIDPCPPPSYFCFATPASPVALIGPIVDPRAVALQARNSLALPAPAVNLNPSTRQNQLVQVPTWMWVDGAGWGARSSTASVPGVTVTATATPQRVIWDMGNGERVVCPGPGTAYDTSRGEAGQHSDCYYTYRHPGYMTVSATVVWTVTWSVAGAPGGGTLPGMFRTTSVPVTVAEAQAINIG